MCSTFRIHLKFELLVKVKYTDHCLHLPFTVQKLGRDPSDEDCFFDLLSKFQSSRMDDQRCHLDEPQNGEGAANSTPSLNDMIGQ